MDIALVLIILAAAIVLFATERFPIELVAMMILGLLLVLKLVTPEEGVSGFSNRAVVTVAAMFVLSVGLEKTGTLLAPARALARVGKHYTFLLVTMMAVACGVSAFISNTAVVAVLLPLVLSVAARRQVPASKLLIPLSFASQFGGVCTLIGTSSNLLVSSISERAGYGEFSVFEMGQLGIILMVVGIAYFLLIGRFLLPSRAAQELTARYQLGEYITELRVPPRSVLIGKTILQSKFGHQYDVTVLEILRDKQKLWSPLEEPIRENDILLVRGKVKDLMELKTATNLKLEPQFRVKDASLTSKDTMLVEILIAPHSRLIRHTLSELDFQRRYQALVLAIMRREQTLRDKLKSVPLMFGDALLVQGPRADIAKLRRDEDFIVLDPVEEPSLRRHKMPIALTIFGLVVTLAAFDVMPIMVSAILGCIGMVLTRCITLEEAYQAIDWKVIFLLAGVLPLGIALEKSGAAGFLAGHTLSLLGGYGTTVALACVYLLTAVLTEFMSHGATAVLLSPIAIFIANQLGADPKPFLMAVAFATSTTFSTPVGYQTNSMVYNAGGYRFTDFMRVGIPLNLIFFGISVYFIPRFWPF